jgi:glycosyltransferase involved in cell wall biosynthesis
VRANGQFEAIFVARVGPPLSIDTPREETRFRVSDEDANLYYLYTNAKEFDPVFGTAREKALYTEDWRAFLRVHEPDVVHFQDVGWLGYDRGRETRRALPHAAIVFTLQGFDPICHHQGRMVRTRTLELCYEATPRRCHQCFPDILAQNFFLREHLIKSDFELVDRFIAPSEFLRRRYIEWGLPAEKVHYEPQGRAPVETASDPDDAGQRKRLGFFGEMSEFSGIPTLLDAMKILDREQAGIQLLVRGTGLDQQSEEFTTRIEGLLEETAGSVRSRGPYQPGNLAGLMASVDWVVVPSIWWEPNPLIVREALMHGRPVICSDIGGMAEWVQDGVNGLHFRVRDPYSLADTIRHAISTQGLWKELRSNIGVSYTVQEHAAAIEQIYSDLLERDTERTAAAAANS